MAHSETARFLCKKFHPEQTIENCQREAVQEHKQAREKAERAAAGHLSRFAVTFALSVLTFVTYLAERQQDDVKQRQNQNSRVGRAP